MADLDSSAFLSLHGLSGHFATLDFLGIFFAEYLAYAWLIALVVAVFLPGARQAERRAAVAVGVAAALVARFAVKAAITLAYPRPRPFLVLPDARPLIGTPVGEWLQSFPSGHALAFFSIAAVLFCFNKKVGALAFAAAAFMGVARVYAGVHWPSDILGGAALGTLVGLAAYRLYNDSSVLLTRLRG